MDNNGLLAYLLNRESRTYERHTQILSNIYYRMIENEYKNKVFNSNERDKETSYKENVYDNALSALEVGFRRFKGIAKKDIKDYDTGTPERNLLELRDALKKRIAQEEDPVLKNSKSVELDNFLSNKDFESPNKNSLDTSFFSSPFSINRQNRNKEFDSLFQSVEV